MKITSEDPIVEEARAAGRAYFARFKNLPAAFADLRRQTEELRRAGRRVVSPPRRRAQPRAAAKMVGWSGPAAGGGRNR